MLGLILATGDRKFKEAKVHPQKLKASNDGRTGKRQVRVGVTGQSEQADSL